MNLFRAVMICALLVINSSLAFAKAVTVQVQMKTYDGEKSYSALYLVNPNGRYEKTLWVSGDEAKWYEEGLSRWWKYLSRKPQGLDALTGATVGSGDRYLVVTELDDKYLDRGYVLRVESSVEDQENFSADAEIELSSNNQRVKAKGNGWVRYLRFKW